MEAYRRKVVMPRVRHQELRWLREGIQNKGAAGLVPYRSIAPPLRPWSVTLRQVRWGRTMWRFFRAWGVARLCGRLPLCIWDGAAPEAVLPKCPACGEWVVGLRHVLCQCPLNNDLRRDLLISGVDLLQWSLTGSNDPGLLAARVRFVGLCCARVAHLRR